MNPIMLEVYDDRSQRFAPMLCGQVLAAIALNSMPPDDHDHKRYEKMRDGGCQTVVVLTWSFDGQRTKVFGTREAVVSIAKRLGAVPIGSPLSEPIKAKDTTPWRCPLPWRVRHDEPYEASIVDANGRQIEGLSVWLDDACHDGNDARLRNAEFVVRAVNGNKS